jgi:putative spermidine/putrescine transport system substrate-binding protein
MRLLKSLALASAASVVAIATVAIAQDKQPLTIVSWGGAYSMSQQKAYSEPYTAKTGTPILNEDKSNEALAGVRSQVEAGQVTWDIVDMLQSDAQRACEEGLLQKINPDEWLAPAPDGTPASQDFIEGTLGDCFIPQILYATLFAYDTRDFPNGGPQTIADIWDVQKFPGTRALENIPQKNLEWALIADGVPAEEVYTVLATEEGQDRAFKKLDELKPNIIWWTQGAQPPQLLADGEATIATAYNGRIFAAQVDEKQPFQIMWDRQMFEVDGWTIPVGIKNEAGVKDYILFATDTQRLADQSKYIAYAPARKSSIPLVGKHEATGEEMLKHMPTQEDNFKTAVRFDTDFWATYGDALEERWNAWVNS